MLLDSIPTNKCLSHKHFTNNCKTTSQHYYSGFLIFLWIVVHLECLLVVATHLLMSCVENLLFLSRQGYLLRIIPSFWCFLIRFFASLCHLGWLGQVWFTHNNFEMYHCYLNELFFFVCWLLFVCYWFICFCTIYVLFL